MSLSFTQGPAGLEFKTESVTVTCTDALSKGNLVEFTLASAGYAACIKSTAAVNGSKVMMGVALEDATAGSQGRIGVRGEFTATVDTAVIAGDMLGASASVIGNLDIADTGSKLVGIALEDSASNTAQTQILFDGITGFATITA